MFIYLKVRCTLNIMSKLSKYLLPTLKSVLRYKTFHLGTGHVTRYTIIEIRSLFSIYIHEISTDCQDRFHTHAFNAIGWTFSGSYIEEQIPEIGSTETPIKKRISGVRIIPRMLNHKLLQAEPDTNTLLITGPYHDLWTEETDDYVRLLTKHGIEIGKIMKPLSLYK